MAVAKFNKDPDARIDYVFDYTAWLEGDAIQTSAWFIEEASPTLIIFTSSNTASTATVWLEGGTVGEKYFVVNRIETTGGRRDDHTLEVTVKDK